MDKLKIAYISTEYPPQVYGGLGVYVDSISRELASLGCRISVFTLGGKGLKRRETRKGITAFREDSVSICDGLQVFFSPETIAWGEGLKFLCDLISFNQLSASDIVQDGGFQLCVAHDWLGLPGAMAARRAGIPMIYHVHSLEVGRSARPNPQIVELERKGASMADTVLTVSHAMKGQLASMGVPEEKIKVCYHGVDAKAFSPESVKPSAQEELRLRYGLSPDDEVILFVGRLEPVKGVIQMLEAMPSVLANHPNAKLLIIGKGTLEDRVRWQIEQLGGAATLVTNFLDLQSKVQHYGLADVCVFPSIYEPFGIVAVEAAAMEVPAVVGASGISGLREIVENPLSFSPTGVHVNPQSPDDIAWGINTVLEDPDRRIAWGKNARQRCLSIFTWPRAAEETLKVYREVEAGEVVPSQS